MITSIFKTVFMSLGTFATGVFSTVLAMGSIFLAPIALILFGVVMAFFWTERESNSPNRILQ